MRALLLVSIALLAVGTAHAAPVVLPDTVINTADNTSDSPSISWFLPTTTDPGYISPWYRYGFQDWGWGHDVTYLPDPCPSGSGIFSFTSGTLVVHAWGVNDDDPILIYGDGVLLGSLQTQPPGWGNTWTTTTFNLSPAFLESWLTDGNMEVWMDIDSTWIGSGVILDWAHLTINYEWECCPSPVVPAPAGVALVGVGTALLGWLRRRQYF